MLEFLTQHQFWTVTAIYWLFSAAVSSMPEPSADGRAGYLWLYRFLHTIAGNITTAFGSRIPGLKILFLALLAPIVLSTAACGAHYRIHPGALNSTDSAAYDTLLVAQALIDQVRAENQTRPLSAGTKDALNVLVESYNTAREAWLIYRGAVATNVASDQHFQNLAKNLTDLTRAIRALKQTGVNYRSN